MKANVGNIDKSIRIGVALLVGLLVYFKVLTGTVATIALVASAVLVLTSLVGFCPLYRIIGISTCNVKKA